MGNYLAAQIFGLVTLLNIIFRARARYLLFMVRGRLFFILIFFFAVFINQPEFIIVCTHKSRNIPIKWFWFSLQIFFLLYFFVGTANAQVQQTHTDNSNKKNT